MERRIIGEFQGTTPGPVLIALGGMHGNEKAGVRAIEKVFGLLEKEPAQNPGFVFKGSFYGISGNLQALAQGKRFLHRDLNRILEQTEIDQIRSLPVMRREAEDKECLELIQTIDQIRVRHQGESCLLLDLHTTTAYGGVFSITDEDPVSLSLAKGLHVPVILGFAGGLRGTTLDYYNRPEENMHCVVFEAGQHDDPASVDRTVSAIINCMRSIGCVQPKDVDHRHDGMLMEWSKGFPKVTRLAYHYKIGLHENFIMRPGFQNFDRISKGMTLADSDESEVLAPYDGYILMPKYQLLGDDGFFIVEEVAE